MLYYAHCPSFIKLERLPILSATDVHSNGEKHLSRSELCFLSLCLFLRIQQCSGRKEKSFSTLTPTLHCWMLYINSRTRVSTLLVVVIREGKVLICSREWQGTRDAGTQISREQHALYILLTGFKSLSPPFSHFFENTKGSFSSTCRRKHHRKDQSTQIFVPSLPCDLEKYDEWLKRWNRPKFHDEPENYILLHDEEK